MTIHDAVLLISALATLIAALACLIAAPRQPP